MILLVHGGLHGDMDAEAFWIAPGIVADLAAAGHDVLAPDRPAQAGSWVEEGDWLQKFIGEGPAVVVAGSNGCSAALRLALDHRDTVAKLVLCWPATPAEDETSDTIRGVTDDELASLVIPVAVIPSKPFNLHHQTKTVDALRRLVPHSTLLPGSPESPDPAFPDHRPTFIRTLLSVL